MVRLLTGALHGTPAVQYPGGAEGRAADIEAGAGRAASELVADVIRSDEAVDAAFAAMTDEAWTNTVEFRDGRVRTADRCASSRWREVEIHHVDLDLDRYTIADWPAEFVAFVLPGELSRLGKRLGAGQAVEIGGIRYGSSGAEAATVDGPDFAVLAWLIGRPRLAAPHLDTAALPELPPWG
jgi:maleylpyruvate isomerase